MRRSQKYITYADFEERVALIHMDKKFFKSTPFLTDLSLFLDPIFSHIENWGKWVFPNISKNTTLLLICPYEPPRDFCTMSCEMISHLTIPCLFIYPNVWSNVFQRFFGLQTTEFIDPVYYTISNNVKDFRIAYKFFP